jgi:hypothetical protein
MVLDNLLPSIQPQSFLEWTWTSFEQPLAEFYIIRLEEHLQVASEMLVVGICSSFYSLQNSPELFNDIHTWSGNILKVTFMLLKQ